jgi:hypothetical protein
MKSFFLSIAILATTVLASNSLTAAPTPLSDNATATLSSKFIGIWIEIGFGRKQADGGCQGRGICYIKGGVELRTTNPGPIATGEGRAFAEMVNGRLQLSFDITAMRLETMCSEFGNGSFLIPQDTQVPSDVAAKLGVRGYNIKAGKYPVKDNGKSLVVVL